jgi:hypothetical protein
MSAKLIRFPEIMAAPLSPVEWTVDGIIEAPARAIFYGEWGSLKTWLLLDLALSIAAGREWLGHFSIPKTRSVLYLNEEDSERRIRRRLKRLALGSGLESSDLALAVLCRTGVRFNDPEEAKGLLTWMQKVEFDAEVIIAEPMIALHSGDENSSRDIRRFWDSLGPFYDAGKTFIVSHHMAKPKPNGNSEVRHRAAGSRDILAGVDDGIGITREAKDRLLLEAVKTRDADESPRFRVSFFADGMDGSASFDFEGCEDGAAPGKLTLAKRLTIDAIAGDPKGTADASEIKARLAACGIPERTAEKALTDLVTRGQIVRTGRGVYALPASLKEAA